MNPAPAPGSLPPLVPPSAPTSSWSSPVQLALAFLLGIATTLIGIQSFGFWRWVGRPSDLDQKQIVIYRVNLNQANRAELLQLPGIRDTLAERIEEHRTKSGGFRSVEELEQVPGIGKATLEKLRPWVYVDSREENPQPGLEKNWGAPRKVVDPNDPININQATAEELQRLPGIGATLSKRIVDERQKRPFKTVEELRRVSGIGPKTVEKLRPLVITENKSLSTTGAD